MANIDAETIDAIDPDRVALVVVDAQRGFTDEGCTFARDGMDVSMAAEALPRVRTLIDTARAADVPVAFTRSERRADGKDAPERVFDVYPAAYDNYGKTTLREGTADVEYSAGVEPRPDEYEVEKQFENAFHGTRLETHLRTENVDVLLFCGFTSNVCVESTVRGAHERGFNIVVVEDCCAATEEEMHESMLRNVEYMFGVTASLDDVADLLDVGEPAET
jgi:nicotinamidase-related amidase